MSIFKRHFSSSVIIFFLALIIGFYLGGAKGFLTVLFLSLLETSLSVDNAVVNAGILRHWGAVWRRRFLTWGMWIAVFGVRLILPILIVAVALKTNPWTVLVWGIEDSARYASALRSAHHMIAGFGGAYLFMVFFHFFINARRNEHWLTLVERPLAMLARIQILPLALTASLLWYFSSLITDSEQRTEFFVAGILGIAIHIGIHLLNWWSQRLGEFTAKDTDNSDKNIHTPFVIKEGVTGFLYLEIMDASFSLDGVIGAFALTDQLAIIMLGLGTGALFVRSFTIFMVERQTLSNYRYLEHGAFWAIGTLAPIMLLGASRPIPEALPGILGTAMIILSMWSSLKGK